MNQFWNKWAGLLLLFCFLFNACAGSKKVNYKSPKSVSLAFYKALANNDYERAKKMGTPETIEVISLLQNLGDLFFLTNFSSKEEQERAKDERAKQLKLLTKITCIIRREAAEDIATCKICCDEKGIFIDAPLILKKENSEWLVHMTKESLE